MARAPSARSPTAAELADDLRRFETGRLVTARRYFWRARFRRWLRARRGAVLAGAAVAAVALIAAWLAAHDAPGYR